MRDVRGFHYTIPNGEIRVVANTNKDWTRALVDLNIAYGEDLDRVSNILFEVAEKFANDPEFSQDIKSTPEVVGPLVLDNWAIVMRVLVKTEPGRRLEITRELQKRAIQACSREGISLSYPGKETWGAGR